jgi:nucleoside-diphosphate-sugar epimerase
VSDLVEGILRVIQCDFSEPINLGNPNEKTILDFAEKIVALTQSKGKIRFCPLPEDDPKTRCPDISRAKKLLGWEPLVHLDEGLELTHQYFKLR